MAKKEELAKKYPSVAKNFVERFYEGDPTKTKKYFEYFLKTWTNRHQQVHFTSPKLIEMVRSFDELLPYIDNIRYLPQRLSTGRGFNECFGRG